MVFDRLTANELEAGRLTANGLEFDGLQDAHHERR